jgi:hypothetical protein
MMWNRNRYWSAILVAGVAVAGAAFGEGNKKQKPLTPAQLKSLDSEADRAQESYLGSLNDLAKSYEDAGQVERAKAMLESILKIDPKNDMAVTKLKQFDEAVFDSNSMTMDVDASHGWTTANLGVRKGKAVRFAATGSYKFVVSETVGPDGYSTKDVVQDMADAPPGALVGVIMPPQKAPGEKGEERRAGRAFFIGSESEYTPIEDGYLYLKLNVPPGSKSAGKIRVIISGNFQRVSG